MLLSVSVQSQRDGDLIERWQPPRRQAVQARSHPGGQDEAAALRGGHGVRGRPEHHVRDLQGEERRAAEVRHEGAGARHADRRADAVPQLPEGLQEVPEREQAAAVQAEEEKQEGEKQQGEKQHGEEAQ